MSTQRSDVAKYKPGYLDSVKVTFKSGMVVGGIVSKVSDTEITVCDPSGGNRSFYTVPLTGSYAATVEKL